MDIIENSCGKKSGRLNACSPLAVAYVPMQQSADGTYYPDEAVSRGTLFPELDLPFKNMVNAPLALNTPKAELLALDFVAHELSLYLDTHKDDIEAFEIFKSVLGLTSQGRERYIRLYGPVSLQDQSSFDEYGWTDDPWPWDYGEE